MYMPCKGASDYNLNVVASLVLPTVDVDRCALQYTKAESPPPGAYELFVRMSIMWFGGGGAA